METQQMEAANEAALVDVAKWLLKQLGDRRVIAFRGEMGAGKTTFIKVFCTLLGVQEEMSSPTFSIVNEYRTAEGSTVYHFDFYRIKDETEALDMGYEDYFYSGDFCLIEWPERVPNLLPPDYLHVHIEDQNGPRLFTIPTSNPTV